MIAVNHLDGHLASWMLGPDHPGLPHVALVVSGGHTELYCVESIGRHFFLGRTRDDAAGEAFDKAAKMLGLGYPGGPAIDRLARKGDPTAVTLPRPMIDHPGFDFSFSGLKTALRRILATTSGEATHSVENLAASFQAAVVDVLVDKTIQAARHLDIGEIVVTGGVAANTALRERMTERGEALGIRVRFPLPAHCTDNAGMIAAAAYYRWRSGYRDSMDFNAVPNLRPAVRTARPSNSFDSERY